MNLFFANSNSEGRTNMTEDTEQSAEIKWRPGKTTNGMASNNDSSNWSFRHRYRAGGIVSDHQNRFYFM